MRLPLKTIDLKKIAADQGITETAAKAMLRRRLKEGLIWSRLNPDLLNPGELLPCMTVEEPPSSPAALAPFPVAREKLKGMDAGKLDGEFLAREKINWCYQGRRGAGRAVIKRVAYLMAYYEPKPFMGARYCWFQPNPDVSPYLTLLRMLLPAFANFALVNPAPPQPPLSGEGEAWQSAIFDDFGVDFQFSATMQADEVIFALSLLEVEESFCLQNYKLSPERYVFLRQQLFFLLSTRLEPWLPGNRRPNVLQGTIYKKP
jgi:hypothetical protein